VCKLMCQNNVTSQGPSDELSVRKAPVRPRANRVERDSVLLFVVL
jgi:hypothetical protein